MARPPLLSDSMTTITTPSVNVPRLATPEQLPPAATNPIFSIKIFMTIAKAILSLQPGLDDQQLTVVAHQLGPALVLAGPGSGKTASLSWRALNLLLLGRVAPQNLLLCTFTRAAAREMRQRLTASAQVVGYQGDISAVRVTTVHGLCLQVLSKLSRNRGGKTSGRVISAAEQLDILKANFRMIFSPDQSTLVRHGWSEPKRMVNQARRFFDRIADELIDPQDLVGSGDPFLEALGRCNQRYLTMLGRRGLVDFAGLQTGCLRLLDDPQAGAHYGRTIDHLMVDEYQDTNIAQQEIIFRLAAVHRNICVVGDEDQLIYAFRGANPDGFDTFRRRFPDAVTHFLTANYRSHHGIVDLYNRWIGSFDWSNPDPGGPPFRQTKLSVAHAAHADDDHPGVISVLGHDQTDEGRQIAALLHLLKDQGFIDDFDGAAVLLPSVKDRHSRRVVDALKRSGVPVHRLDAEDHVAHVGGGSPAGPHPSGHVLLTTIHQAKGREWPVVFVGGLHAADLRTDALEVDLGPFLKRTAAEPTNLAPRFDLARQYFVAFSRAQKLLVITARREPHSLFTSLWDTVPAWTSTNLGLLSGAGKFSLPDRQASAVAGGLRRLIVPKNGTLIIRTSSGSAPRLAFPSCRHRRVAR